MSLSNWIQVLLYVGLLLAIPKPLGIYLFHVLDAEGKTYLDPLLRPIERLLYKLFGVNPRKEQTWVQYGVAMLMFSMVTMLFTYGILRLQNHLPFHQYVDALSNKTELTPALSFNTSASFTTNTNWQSYGGENTMSYFSQMVGLTFHNFMSAAVGICVAAVVVHWLRNAAASLLAASAAA